MGGDFPSLLVANCWQGGVANCWPKEVQEVYFITTTLQTPVVLPGFSFFVIFTT
jgi:hypothetical protein